MPEKCSFTPVNSAFSGCASLVIELYRSETRLYGQALINDIAKVEVTGNRRSGLEDFDGAEAWRDISKYCNKHKKTKILVISKLEGALSTLPSYDIAISLTDFGINENSKIAFVDLRKQSREVNSFTSSFVKKKGIRIEVFADEKDAFEWLSNE